MKVASNKNFWRKTFSESQCKRLYIGDVLFKKLKFITKTSLKKKKKMVTVNVKCTRVFKNKNYFHKKNLLTIKASCLLLNVNSFATFSRQTVFSILEHNFVYICVWIFFCLFLNMRSCQFLFKKPGIKETKFMLKIQRKPSNEKAQNLSENK